MLIRFAAIEFGILVLLVAQLPAHGQYFRDNFDGSPVVTDTGIDVNWLPLTPFEAGERRVEGGAYVIEPGSVPNQGNLSESDSFVENVLVADGSLRTRVSVSGTSRGYFFGVFARNRIDENDSSDAGIFTTMNASGRISIGAFDQETGAENGTMDFTSLIPHDTSIEMQFDMLGDTAFLTVWEVGSDKPDGPQLELTIPDSLASQGEIGMWAARNLNQGPMSAAFEFFEVAPIPEPSSGSLALFGITFLGAIGRRRRTPR